MFNTDDDAAAAKLAADKGVLFVFDDNDEIDRADGRFKCFESKELFEFELCLNIKRDFFL